MISFSREDSFELDEALVEETQPLDNRTSTALDTKS